MAISTLSFTLSLASPRIEIGAGNSWGLSCSVRSQVMAQMQKDGRGRRVWRRRKLTKKDDMLRYKLGRVPFLEEQERKIKESGKELTMDIERLLLSEENRFDFVNEVAAEANEYVENNRDEYGGKKKAILHVLSNRLNDAGVSRQDAYEESDPYKPGPNYMKEFYT
ncbi:protein PLASTID TRANSCRIPTIONALLY ACTIVE 7 [Fagus crenata]